MERKPSSKLPLSDDTISKVNFELKSQLGAAELQLRATIDMLEATQKQLLAKNSQNEAMGVKLEICKDHIADFKKNESSDRLLLQSFFDYALPLLARLTDVKSLYEELLVISASSYRPDAIDHLGMDALIDRYKTTSQPIGRPFDYSLFLRNETGNTAIYATQFKTAIELFDNLGANGLSLDVVRVICDTLPKRIGLKKVQDQGHTENRLERNNSEKHERKNSFASEYIISKSRIESRFDGYYGQGVQGSQLSEDLFDYIGTGILPEDCFDGSLISDKSNIQLQGLLEDRPETISNTKRAPQNHMHLFPTGVSVRSLTADAIISDLKSLIVKIDRPELKAELSKDNRKLVSDLADHLNAACHRRLASKTTIKCEISDEISVVSQLDDKDRHSEEINLYTQVFDGRRSAVVDSSNKKKEKARLLEALNNEISCQNHANNLLQKEITQLESQIEEAKLHLVRLSRTQVKLELERDFNKVKLSEISHLLGNTSKSKDDSKRNSLPLDNDLRGYPFIKSVEGRRSIESHASENPSLAINNQTPLAYDKDFLKAYEMNTTQKKPFSGIKGNFAESMPLIYQDGLNYEHSTHEPIDQFGHDDRLLLHGFSKQKLNRALQHDHANNELRPDYFPSKVPLHRYIGSPAYRNHHEDKQTLFLTSSFQKMHMALEAKQQSMKSSESKLNKKKSNKEFYNKSNKLEYGNEKGNFILEGALTSRKERIVDGNIHKGKKFNQISQNLASMIANAQKKTHYQSLKTRKDRLRELYSDLNELSSQNKSEAASQDHKKVNSYGLLPYYQESGLAYGGFRGSKVSRVNPFLTRTGERATSKTIYSSEDANPDRIGSPVLSDRRKLNKTEFTVLTDRGDNPYADELRPSTTRLLDVIDKNLSHRAKKPVTKTIKADSASKKKSNGSPDFDCLTRSIEGNNGDKLSSQRGGSTYDEYRNADLGTNVGISYKLRKLTNSVKDSKYFNDPKIEVLRPTRASKKG